MDKKAKYSKSFKESLELTRLFMHICKPLYKTHRNNSNFICLVVTRINIFKNNYRFILKH